jgi:hypothetical protein
MSKEAGYEYNALLREPLQSPWDQVSREGGKARMKGRTAVLVKAIFSGRVLAVAVWQDRGGPTLLQHLLDTSCVSLGTWYTRLERRSGGGCTGQTIGLGG